MVSPQHDKKRLQQLRKRLACLFAIFLEKLEPIERNRLLRQMFDAKTSRKMKTLINGFLFTILMGYSFTSLIQGTNASGTSVNSHI